MPIGSYVGQRIVLCSYMYRQVEAEWCSGPPLRAPQTHPSTPRGCLTTPGGSLSSDERKAPGVVRCVGSLTQVNSPHRLSPWCRADGHPSLSERLGYEVSDLIRISWCVSCGTLHRQILRGCRDGKLQLVHKGSAR